MISPDQLAEWFELFWLAYWLKIAKKAAFKAFQKQVRSEETFAAVMDGLRIQHYSMMKRRPEFRPHASTWLNGERWNDVLPLSIVFNFGHTTFQTTHEQQALNGKYDEYETSPVVPTVPAGPTADEWRKKQR